MELGANGERRRSELADFLRKKRASLKPEDVGLPNGSRRRFSCWTSWCLEAMGWICAGDCDRIQL